MTDLVLWGLVAMAAGWAVSTWGHPQARGWQGLAIAMFVIAFVLFLISALGVTA